MKYIAPQDRLACSVYMGAFSRTETTFSRDGYQKQQMTSINILRMTGNRRPLNLVPRVLSLQMWEGWEKKKRDELFSSQLFSSQPYGSLNTVTRAEEGWATFKHSFKRSDCNGCLFSS